MPLSSIESPAHNLSERQRSWMCTVVAHYRFKKHLHQRLFDQVAFIGDHLLHTTEHLHHCYAMRVRSQLFYNEVMSCLESVADGCVEVRDDLVSKGVCRITWVAFRANGVRLSALTRRLRFVCQHQGVSQFSNLVGVEFDRRPNVSEFDWWQRFVHTSFVPLSYSVYKIHRHTGEIGLRSTMDPFDSNTKRRFTQVADMQATDIPRIQKLLSSASIENRCYLLKDVHRSTRAPGTAGDASEGSGTGMYKGNRDAGEVDVHTLLSTPNGDAPAGVASPGGCLSTPIAAIGAPPGPGSSTLSSNDAPQLPPYGNTSSLAVSLVEYINGARVYVPLGDYVVALGGYFRNDSFQMMSSHMPLWNKTRQLRELITSNSVVPEAFAAGWTQQLSLRDQLVYDVYQLNENCIRDYQRLQHLKSKTISTLVKEFLSSPLYVQREIMTLFLLTEHNSDTQYLAYLMYDMISQDSYLLKPQPQAEEIYNNLHWVVKKRFRVVIENISQFTKQLSGVAETDINYESRILLMKAPDAVKKKAMEKLKEVQSKSGNDTNHKAQQYLDGILRIPFGIYRREHMFTFLDAYRERLCMYAQQYTHAMCGSMGHDAHGMCTLHKELLKDAGQPLTFNRIDAFLQAATGGFESSTSALMSGLDLELLHKFFANRTYSDLTRIVTTVKKQLGLSRLEYAAAEQAIGAEHQTKHSGLCRVRVRQKVDGKMTRVSPEDIVQQLLAFCVYTHDHYPERWLSVHQVLPYDTYDPQREMHMQFHKQLTNFRGEWRSFKQDTRTYMESVDSILEKSVYGHTNAKRSIKQVIAQWITGDLKGYCFGFEGPPGTGKTSLAKNGLSKCLVDINGEKRPFAFIALGGSSNGSTLEGHSYTYVGSIWGRIVDILMETECMNPIIYVDELDKISRTEQGRELVGILTHMTDSTQNEEFMDKYFAGIKIDLSRVLFVFSYNDPDLLDPILRDRIHVVRFSPLKQADKHEVCNRHLVPEILRTVGLSGQDIQFPTETIDFIIDNYTAEGGVRRLKEKLFEISRDLNIRHLTDEATYAFPYTVTPDFLQNDLFAEHPVIRTKTILETPRVGLTNGMYATSMGVGGITIIECFVVPKTAFMALELTGQQGDVMKESMSVAKTVAWNLLTEATKTALHNQSKTNSFGLHIHCPDGGTPKDGPSAGTAITVSIISSLLGLPVNNTVAITGEIDLNGQVCQIGGLDTKIRGAKKAGVKTVLFPRSNEHDLKNIKRAHSPFEDGQLEYKMVDTIWDVLPYVFPGSEYAFVKF